MSVSQSLPATFRSLLRIYRTIAAPMVLLITLTSILIAESIITPTDATLVLTLSMVGGGLISWAVPGH